ncbi:hypothetical protein HDU96_010636 [Phlyctochytrium bullatum]|nr:hypothetical protein HDU96_010636 [Phlyctochytrium bullatum]
MGVLDTLKALIMKPAAGEKQDGKPSPTKLPSNDTTPVPIVGEKAVPSTQRHLQVEFENSDPAGVGSYFLELIPAPHDTLASMASTVLRNLQYSCREDLPSVDNISVSLCPLRGNQIGFVEENGGRKKTIQIAVDYINKLKRAKDPAAEIEGLLWHELAAALIHDGRVQPDGEATAPPGVLSGLADLVRLKNNRPASNWPKRWEKPSSSARWDDGYSTTAYFLLFIEEQAQPRTPNFGAQLNKLLQHNPWSKNLIVQLTGRSVELLWSEYIRRFDPRPPSTWPIPILTVIQTDGESPGGKIFRTLFPDDEVYGFAEDTCRNVMIALYDSPDEVPKIRSYTLVIEAMDGIAYCVGEKDKEIHLSTNYIADTQSASLDDTEALSRTRTEIEGVLVHESVHAFQHSAGGSAPGGLIEGVADLVRLHHGLAPPHWRKSARGKKWDSGYDATAYFLDFIESDAVPPVPRFTAKLNAKMGTKGWRWTDDVFAELTDRTLKELWTAYRASIPSENGPRGEDGWPCPVIKVVNKESEDDAPPVFSTVIPDKDAQPMFAGVSRTVLQTMYGQLGAAVAPGHVATLTLVVRAMDGVPAYCTGDTDKEIHLNTTYLRSQASKGVEHLRREIMGILVHEVTHAWQWWQAECPSGLTEGIADWVRLVNGYEPPHWRKTKGGEWDDGYSVTAYFLEWVEAGEGRKGFVNALNASMDSEEEWDEDVFKKLTGKSVDQLWKEYQRSIK